MRYGNHDRDDNPNNADHVNHRPVRNRNIVPNQKELENKKESVKHEQQGPNGELITVIPRRNSFNVRSNTEESVKNLIKLTNDYITQNNLVPKQNLNNIGINKGKIKAKMG